jgi:pimeloyl-ACP methyl ester carboxylesterase
MENEIKNNALDLIGSSVDELFLAVPRILKYIKPKRNIDKATYEKQVDYYIDNGFVDNPTTFFSFPEKMPAYKVISQKPYKDGISQIISYPSNYKTRNPLIRDQFDSYTSNKTGYIIRWSHGDKNRKTVLCHHGFMLGDPGQARQMFKMRKLYSMGLDVALFIAPFHWRRTPGTKASRRLFLQPDNVVMTCECFGQSMWDLYSTFLILKDLGTDEIGLIGASLGGHNAALFICLTDIASFAAIMVPAVKFSYPFGPDSMKMRFHVDDDLKRKLDRVWEFHSPLNLSPKIPRDKILIVASRGDRLCPFQYVNELAEKWDIKNRYFLTGGHWLVFNNIRGQVWYNFLEQMGFTQPK